MAPLTTVVDVHEADLSDLDIRKLHNLSILDSPVPRFSPTVLARNTAKLNESVEMTSSKAAVANTSQQQLCKLVSESAQKLQNNMPFIELTTPERQNYSAYPHTPFPVSAENLQVQKKEK